MVNAVNNSSNNSTASIIYELKVPLVQGTEVVKELKFIRPKLKHLKKIDGITGEITKLCKLLEILCNISAMMVDEIDPQDLDGINKIVSDFFPAAQAT